jgi:uncharacterized protein (TIGR02996 family)
MQTEAEAFLQRIRAYPDDDAQRLIFADWLDEEGDPRGKFVRVQLALAELPGHDPALRDLLTQERELLAAHRDAWEAPFRGLATGCVFRRGFVDEVKVEARQFVRHAHEIFAAAPVRHVHLLDVSDNLSAVMQSPYLGRLAALTVFASHLGEPLARAVARSEYVAGLRRLTLTRNRFGDDAAEQLARSPHLTALEDLDLGENEIGESGARALAAAPAWANLRRLELRDNRLGPAGAEALAGSERLPALRRLGLSGNDVGLPRLQSLARGNDLLRVPELDLSVNGLTAAGLQVILTKPPGGDPAAVRLTELDLSGNAELGDAGARVLTGPPHLANLTVLRLAGCGVGNDGARALARCPHLMNRLETLDLTANPIDDAGLRAFLETGPQWRALRQLLIPRIGIADRLRQALDSAFRPRRK